MSVIPPKLASRASPQGAGAALGRPGGGAIPPKLASRASPPGAGAATGRGRARWAAPRARPAPSFRRGGATRAERASLGEAV